VGCVPRLFLQYLTREATRVSRSFTTPGLSVASKITASLRLPEEELLRSWTGGNPIPDGDWVHVGFRGRVQKYLHLFTSVHICRFSPCVGFPLSIVCHLANHQDLSELLQAASSPVASRADEDLQIIIPKISTFVRSQPQLWLVRRVPPHCHEWQRGTTGNWTAAATCDWLPAWQARKLQYSGWLGQSAGVSMRKPQRSFHGQRALAFFFPQASLSASIPWWLCRVVFWHSHWCEDPEKLWPSDSGKAWRRRYHRVGTGKRQRAGSKPTGLGRCWDASLRLLDPRSWRSRSKL
jgi:hypothetical protein